jgi:hypothetical protein
MPPIRRRVVTRNALIAIILAASLAPASRAPGLDERKGAGTHSRKASLFSESEYRDHLSYLASDALEGRGTGQAGIDKAAEYIADYFEKCGVRPAGDDGTYFQNFALKLKNRIGEGTRLAIGLPGRVGRRSAKLGVDYTPLPFSGSGEFKGEVVFAGYGLSEEDYDDYKDLDVSGKIVLVLRRAPKFKDFGMMSSGFRGKASKANAHDAAAVLVVNPSFDEEGDKLYDFNADSFGGMNMMMGRRGFGVPMMHISRSLANKLLKAGGLPDTATLEKTIEETQGPASAPLKGVTVKGRVNIEPIDTPARNVIGMIPGTGPQKDEIIVCGAHYDHLGIRRKGEEGFNPEKDISNGADDNASGTSLIMTLARVYTKGAAPNRTLLLMCFTGEELGLLGSAHFAQEPTIDLDRVVAMLNFDMVGRLKDDKLEVGGMRTGGFEEMVKKQAERHQLIVKDGGGGRGPSDHTSFYNKNIPVLFFFTGIHKQYHQPTDDVPLVNMDGAVRIAKYAADVLDEIDAQTERPVFAKDSKGAAIMRQRDGDEKEGEEPAVAAGPGRRGRLGDRPRLGIRPDRDADGEGVVVAEVVEDGAAAQAGIKEGDRIIRIGKKKIESPMDLFDVMGNLKWGETITVEARRGDATVKVELQFTKPQEPAVAAAQPATGVPAQMSEAVASIKKALEKVDGVVDVEIKGKASSGASGDTEYDISFKLKIAGKASSESRPEAKAQTAPKSERRTEAPAERRRSRRQPEARGGQDDPHGDSGDDAKAAEMPPVRLGIMPTYGESEGEGYEISGVVEGGPAARAGMKDSDRIFKIGDKKITNVYEYMDALRKYKPGDEVPVTVLRGGKKLTLKIKSMAQQRREAA